MVYILVYMPGPVFAPTAHDSMLQLLYPIAENSTTE